MKSRRDMEAAISPLLSPGEHIRGVAFGAKGLSWMPWGDAYWNDNLVALTDQRLLIVTPRSAAAIARAPLEERPKYADLVKSLDLSRIRVTVRRAMKTTMRIYVEGKRLPIQVQFKGRYRDDGDEIARLLPKKR